MTLQLYVKGTISGTEPFFGRIGWVENIIPVYSTDGVLLGAKIDVVPRWSSRILRVIPIVGTRMASIVRLPLSNEREEHKYNYLPREIFGKPNLEQLIWMHKNDIDGKTLIEGDYFGVDSYNTQISQLTREIKDWKIYSNNLWMRMQKLRRELAEVSSDNEVDIKDRLKKHLEEIKEYRKTMPSQGPVGRYKSPFGREMLDEQMKLSNEEEPMEEQESPEPPESTKTIGQLKRLKRKIRR